MGFVPHQIYQSIGSWEHPEKKKRKLSGISQLEASMLSQLDLQQNMKKAS
jgi:hypothetical protein